VISHRKRNRIGGAVEQHQHAVGLVDFAAAVLLQQVAGGTVVGCPGVRHRGVTDGLGQLGAVDDVGKKQGANVTHRVVGS